MEQRKGWQKISAALGGNVGLMKAEEFELTKAEEFQLQVEGMVVQCRRCSWCSSGTGEEMSWLFAKAAVSWVSLQAARTAHSCHCLCPGQTQPWGHPEKAP